MSNQSLRILAEALNLPPVERAELVERILASFTFPERKKVDTAWAAEVEDRIDAFDRNEIDSLGASEVIAAIEQGTL